MLVGVSRLSAYRDLGPAGGRYPAWLDELREKNGVYVIRDAGSGGTLYVGESHTGRLYETLTRHVQRWELPEAHTYQRARVEVAFRLTDASDAPAMQREYICTLNPRDNVYDVCEEIPF